MSVTAPKLWWAKVHQHIHVHSTHPKFRPRGEIYISFYKGQGKLIIWISMIYFLNILKRKVSTSIVLPEKHYLINAGYEKYKMPGKKSSWFSKMPEIKCSHVILRSGYLVRRSSTLTYEGITHPPTPLFFCTQGLGFI